MVNFNIKHGHAKEGRFSPAYWSWRAMRDRCNSKGHAKFKYYGGRGIKVCPRWDSFENFLADMGPRPEGTTLDRFPNKDGDYEPGNCRWATWAQQSDNRKPIKHPRDISGLTFGKLTVRSLDHRRARGVSYWLCICDCGKTSVTSRGALISGGTKSCGCLCPNRKYHGTYRAA